MRLENYAQIPNWKLQLYNVQKCPQRQDSLDNQLKDLILIADKFGFNDASDYLKRILSQE